MKNALLLATIALTACTGSRAASRPVVTPSPQQVAQTTDGDRVTVSFSDSSRPGLLRVDLLNGGISVKAYNGKDVIIEAQPPERRATASVTATTAGLHRLDGASTGLHIEEQNNVMTVQADSMRRPVRVSIQVPTRTNLNLHSVNGGAIEVDGVEGEINIENTNGRVIATNVAGSVTAHSMNGGVLVSMRQVTAGKPLSFGSQNGTVDVTLPSTIKATAKMRTGRGEIWTDFDIQTNTSQDRQVQDLRSQGGGYRINVDNNIYGTINGGGPDLTLSTFNGSIYIRRAK